MAEKRDYYEVLGVSRDADDATLKKAYRALAKKYHPDMNPGDAEAEQKFKEINEAYSILSDPEKRAQYDRFGHAAFDPSAGAGGGGSYDFGGFDFGDIFSSFFGGGSANSNSSGFGGSGRSFNFGGGGGSSFGGFGRQNTAVPGEDVGVRVTLSFEEAAFGCKKDITYNRVEACDDCNGTGSAKGAAPEKCPHCHGYGRVTVERRTFMGIMQTQESCSNCRGTGRVIKNACKNCSGKGFVRLTKKLNVTIPEGIDNGQRIALRGQGSAGRNGGANGDLIIEVAVRPHPVFEREGNNLYCEIPISITEATLGAEIDVPTLSGQTTKYTIPEGTQPGTTFTLRGEGVTDVNNGKRGNLIFTVTVEIPKGLTEEQKDLLRKFAEATGDQEEGTKRSSFRKKLRDLFGGGRN